MPRGSIIGVAAGLGVALLLGGAYMLGASSAPREANASQTPQATEDSSAQLGPGPMYVLKDRVVNLADPNGRRYLKIGLSIEFTTGAAEFKKASADQRKEKQAEFERELAPRAPLIEDAIITILAARTAGDLSTPEGKQRLKTDLKDSLNRMLGGDQVSNVYFTQFVMQ
ncbi:MAG: flagellar basal body-associated FliL family protein [Chloroflexota bacterium]